MKKAIILVSGPRLNLVLPDPGKHFKKCLRWINDPKINRYLSRGLFPTSEKDEKDWFDRVNSDDKNVVMIIKLKTGKAIGVIGLHKIDHLSRQAEMGILIGEANEWGNGYATEAEKLIVEYGFCAIGLNRIEARIFICNVASAKAAEKVGFKQEGILREKIYKNGKYNDLLLCAILRKDWKNQ